MDFALNAQPVRSAFRKAPIHACHHPFESLLVYA
jgi:hypothetical protein